MDKKLIKSMFKLSLSKMYKGVNKEERTYSQKVKQPFHDVSELVPYCLGHISKTAIKCFLLFLHLKESYTKNYQGNL